ncbi:MAG: hypothetical protein QJR10_14640 [Bacillota bacterium]|nr:hypothetical protein [Bacillota bacterium]
MADVSFDLQVHQFSFRAGRNSKAKLVLVLQPQVQVLKKGPEGNRVGKPLPV